MSIAEKAKELRDTFAPFTQTGATLDAMKVQSIILKLISIELEGRNIELLLAQAVAEKLNASQPDNIVPFRPKS
jgi:hypothetical protein